MGVKMAVRRHRLRILSVRGPHLISIAAVVLSFAAAGSAVASVVPNQHQLVVGHAMVTAARAGGSSAVEATLRNQGSGPLMLNGVTLDGNTNDMLFRATSLTSGDAPMTYQAQFTLPSHHSLTLGLRGRGAMVANLARALRRGAHVTLAFDWSDARGGTHVTYASATVMAAPAHLSFRMS
jgi:copper(I)-binding protein